MSERRLHGDQATAHRRIRDRVPRGHDRRLRRDSLDRAAAVVNGRHSAEGGPKEAARKRIVLTRRVERVVPDPRNANAVLWNPATAPFDEAWMKLGAGDGTLAVVGGTDVFFLFLSIGYDTFYLTRAPASVPRGRPVFPGIGQHGVTPEDVLQKHGMVLKSRRTLDQAAGVELEEWVSTR
jgi:dihydrofolate reductase